MYLLTEVATTDTVGLDNLHILRVMSTDSKLLMFHPLMFVTPKCNRAAITEYLRSIGISETTLGCPDRLENASETVVIQQAGPSWPKEVALRVRSHFVDYVDKGVSPTIITIPHEMSLDECLDLMRRP
jgi:hypothetical protein